MKINVIAEGPEKDLDLLLMIANRLCISISKPEKLQYTERKTVERITFNNAYTPWSAEDDEKLEILYYAGKKLNELSAVFQRNKGAIQSRIKKLDLVTKYGKK